MKAHRFFSAFSVLVFFQMGCSFAANQFLISNITAAFDASESEMGLMVSALYIGSMVMVLAFGEFAERAGKRIACCAASFLVSIGASIVALAPTVSTAVAGLFLYGAGIGGFESGIIALLSDRHGSRSNRILNLLQALFSLGAVLAPLLLNALLSGDGYRPAYAVMSLLYGAAALYYLFARSIDSFAVKATAVGGLAIFRLLRNPLLLCYMSIMFLYCGMESTVTYWIPSYFHAQGFPALGATALSMYWFASIVGRILGSRFSSAAVLTVPCFFVASLASVLLLALPGGTSKVGTVLLFGLSYGPLYGGLQILGGSLVAENSAAAFSLMIFAAGLGGSLFQPLISTVVRNAGGNAVYLMIAVINFAVAGFALTVNRHINKSHNR